MTDKRKLRELLAAAKDMPEVWGYINGCVYCGELCMSKYGVKYEYEHKPSCRWRKLQKAIKRAEKKGS